MHKITGLVFSLCSLMLLSSCRTDSLEQDFFYSSLLTVESTEGQKIVPVSLVDIPFNPYYSIVYKNYCFCYEMEGDFFISVNDLKNGDLVRGIIRRGRGPMESTFIHPIFSISDDCLDLYDYDKKTIIRVDAKQVLNSKVDSLKSLHHLFNAGSDPFVPFSIHVTDDSTAIVLNTLMSGESDSLIQDPYYASYDLADGTLGRRFSFFRATVPESYSPSFPPKVYLNDFDCVNPEGDKLFFGMAFLPVCGMLDLVSGDVRVYKLDGLKSFNPRKERFQFVSAACSSDKVYALYSGAVGAEKLMKRRTDLYVFDWEGNITDRLILDKAYKYVSVSDGKVYLMDYDGYVYTVE